MSMLMSVYALTEADLARVLAEPGLVHALLDCEPGARAAAALPRRECALDRAWQAIHFVLTGELDGDGTGPLGFLLGGGADVGDLDLGYGPARAFRASEVAAIAQELGPVSPEVFAARLDHGAMVDEGIYGVGDDEDEDREYILGAFQELRAFVLAAVEAREGLIVALV